jgi:hypothetical protein
MDQDKDLDLYVVSGGYEFIINDPFLQDRLYENDGVGNFKKKKLPDIFASASCVKPADVDGDGDLDLFIGGRLVPGRYPETPESFILVNDGKGNFSLDSSISTDLRFAGMVTDAVWTDLNGDLHEDLIVVGEWMPIKVLINTNGKLVDKTTLYVKGRTEGFWNCITAADFDHDGDTDFVAGNYGLNSQMKASEKEPATLVYADFDSNGSVDPILNYFIHGKSYPYPTRDELTEQLPIFKKRFTNYAAYSDAGLTDVLTADERSKAKTLTAYQLQSCYIRNDAGNLTVTPLSAEFQFAPIFSLAVMDVNNDGQPDLVSGGNLTGTRARTGKLTGNVGFVFENNGLGEFAFIHPTETGINIAGDVRNMVVDRDRIIIGINNSPLQVYKLEH